MKRWIPYMLAIAATVPWFAISFGGLAHPPAGLTALATGGGILAAAFLLGWACEVAEMDVPAALAVSVLALVAVLPEYAVDATFAWKAAHDKQQASYAIANMTGGNRLLLGTGWSLLLGLSWYRFKAKEIVLPKDMGVEITILIAATLYALVPVWRGSLTLVDTAVYLVLYVSYLIAAARCEEHEGEVVGPARVMAELPKFWRRFGVIACLVYAATFIFVAAEPFAESLVQSGEQLGVDQFFLVQWVAPVASESPEVLVSVLMVMRGASQQGLRTLVSSNVNQWTLLVGTLAAVYSVSKGEPGELHMDDRQRVEVLLTAAQCVFAIAAIADLRFALWQGGVLTGLFALQFLLPHGLVAPVAAMLPEGHVREVFGTPHAIISFFYLAFATFVIVVDKRSRDGVGESIRTFWAKFRGVESS